MRELLRVWLGKLQRGSAGGLRTPPHTSEAEDPLQPGCDSARTVTCARRPGRGLLPPRAWALASAHPLLPGVDLGDYFWLGVELSAARVHLPSGARNGKRKRC